MGAQHAINTAAAGGVGEAQRIAGADLMLFWTRANMGRRGRWPLTCAGQAARFCWWG